ncbi:hypothetical protein CU669_05300 [Paramagnetospirillum kuznetsovii]|uniref:Uncharacterized protein n=1 Tax=Paramagnetospirillum kuznetsovii TaxID=2053833 RepID=A0A364P0X5_9PROT|nr:hypothetical protein CU669_05300 [Paramagnetospirillum kuznetsovii]
MLQSIKWVGTAAGIIGALFLAANVAESGWGFTFFLVSSLAWTWVGVRTRDHALTALQGVFVGIDLLGIVRWLL